MTGEPETDRRPRWRKKRWRFAFAAWLLSLPALYLAYTGPVRYCRARNWISWEAEDRLSRPLRPLGPVRERAFRYPAGKRAWYWHEQYHDYFETKGYEHRAGVFKRP